jgi:hypothetical protein
VATSWRERRGSVCGGLYEADRHLRTPHPRRDSLPAESVDSTRLRGLANGFVLAVFNDRRARVPVRPRPWTYSRSFRERSARGTSIDRKLLIMRTMITGAAAFIGSTQDGRLLARMLGDYFVDSNIVLRVGKFDRA